MLRRRRGQLGQTSLPEYVVTFFLVIGVIVAMTAYVQRTLQARMRDARNYAIKTGYDACDANCLNATGNGIYYEYEPYYLLMNTVSERSQKDRSALIRGGQEGVFIKTINHESTINSYSEQLPPKEAAGE